MKKKIFIILASITLMFALFTMSVHAETSAEVLSEGTMETTKETSTQEHTIFTRIWEYINQNKLILTDAVGYLVIFIAGCVLKIKNDKKTSIIQNGLLSAKKDTSEILDGQSDIVDVVNDLIEGYNGMTAKLQRFEELYTKNSETEEARNRLVSALAYEVSAIMEMLTTVYSQSSNLPQGTKDMIFLKQSKCLKALNDDEKLQGVIEMIKKDVGGAEKTDGKEV